MAARTEKTASNDRRADDAIALPPPGRRARLSALPVAERRDAARRLVDAAVEDLLARGEPVTASGVQRRAGLSQTPLRDSTIRAVIAAAEARSIERVVAAVRLPAPDERRDLRHLPPSHRRAVTRRLVELAVAELVEKGQPVYRESVQRRAGLSDTALKDHGVRTVIATTGTARSERHAEVCDERRARVARALEAMTDEPTQSDIARRAGVPEKFVLQDAECQALCGDAGVRKRRHPVPLRERLTRALLELGAHRPWPLSPGDVCVLAEAPASSLDAHPDLRALVDDPAALERFLSDHGVEVDLPERRRLALAEEQQALTVLRELHGRGEVPTRAAVATRLGTGEGRLKRFVRFERLRAELLGETDAVVDEDVHRFGLHRVDGLNTPATRRDYARRLRRYESWAEATGRKPHPVTEKQAVAWLEARQEAGVQETTLNGDRQALNALARAQGYAPPLPGKHGPRKNRLAEAVTEAYRAAAEYALDPSKPKPGVDPRREDHIDDAAGIALYRDVGLVGPEPGRALVFEGADGDQVRALVRFDPDTTLAWLDDELRELRAREHRRSTHEIYLRRLALFIAFADFVDRSPLPARVDTVTKFLAWLGGGHFDGRIRSQVVLEQCVSAIRCAHRRHRLPSPTDDPDVGRTLKALKRRHGRAPLQSTPLYVPQLRRIADVMEDNGTLRGLRDKAWMLVSFSAGARVSQTTTRKGLDFDDEEVVVLRWRDVIFDGTRQLQLRFTRAKHRDPGEVPATFVDQSSHNTSDWISPTCPVHALWHWKRVMARKLDCDPNDAKLDDLPVFPRLKPCGPRHLGDVRVLAEPIAKAAMAEAFKAWAVLAGVEGSARVTSHSLRIGHINSALDAGADIEMVAHQVDHGHLTTTQQYARGRERARANSSQWLDL
jgi:site-specific recombinase XerD